MDLKILILFNELSYFLIRIQEKYAIYQTYELFIEKFETEYINKFYIKVSITIKEKILNDKKEWIINDLVNHQRDTIRDYFDRLNDFKLTNSGKNTFNLTLCK